MTTDERVRVAARVLVRHLAVACRDGRCSCGQPWSLTHQAAELERAGLLGALVDAEGDFECCASGRCEVCTPGYVWGRDG